MLVHRLLKAMGAVVDADMARCLYAGLVTDTRNFRDAGRGRPPARRRADRGRRGPAHPGHTDHGHPPVPVAGGAGGAAARTPSWIRRRRAGSGWCTPSSPRPTWPGSARRRSTASSTPLRTAAEAEVAAVFKQVGADPVDDLVAVARPGGRRRGGEGARRRGASAGGGCDRWRARRGKRSRRCVPSCRTGCRKTGVNRRIPGVKSRRVVQGRGVDGRKAEVVP